MERNQKKNKDKSLYRNKNKRRRRSQLKREKEVLQAIQIDRVLFIEFFNN